MKIRRKRALGLNEPLRHPDHPRPVTRREFLAQGFITGSIAFAGASAFTLFADPTSTTNPPQFICFPDVDGHQVIPAAVINAIPDSGLIVNADLSHYMESREAAPGEQRRFDLVSIYCNISAYSKQ